MGTGIGIVVDGWFGVLAVERGMFEYWVWVCVIEECYLIYDPATLGQAGGLYTSRPSNDFMVEFLACFSADIREPAQV